MDLEPLVSSPSSTQVSSELRVSSSRLVHLRSSLTFRRTPYYFVSSCTQHRRSNDRTSSGSTSASPRLLSDTQPSTADPRLRSTSTAVADAAAAVSEPATPSSADAGPVSTFSSPQSRFGGRSTSAAVPSHQSSVPFLPQPTSNSPVPKQPNHLPSSHPIVDASLVHSSSPPNRRRNEQPGVPQLPISISRAFPLPTFDGHDVGTQHGGFLL